MATPTAWRASRAKPCPVCGTGTKGCSVTTDDLHVCRGDPQQPDDWTRVKVDSAGFTEYRRGDDASRNGHPKAGTWKAKATGTSTNSKSHGPGFQVPDYVERLSSGERTRFAESLVPGVDPALLDQFHVRLAPAYKDHPERLCIPERNGAGVVIGMATRTIDGEKKCLFGSERGLIIPDGLKSATGPVYAVEGFSDTFAAVACGLRAVGRPNNTGCAAMLGEFLATLPDKPAIIIVGDNDENEAGTVGADQTAAAVAKVLGPGRVKLAAPPPDVKDLRAWVNEDTAGAGETPDFARIGRDMATHFAVAATTVEPPPAGEDSTWKCSPIDSATFAAGDYRQRFLVQRVLVEGQPFVIGGPQKTLKTNIGVDLCLSLASATPFLGTFEVRHPKRVLFLSGESGAYTIRETALRICLAKGVTLANLPIYWQFTLPQLGRPEDVTELGRAITAHKIDVLFLDPLYLSLLAGGEVDARSIFEMGQHLRAIGALCQRANVTPALAHHSRKRIDAGRPMELDDLAFSGIAEFARQWCLINRAARYEGDGNHELLLNVGGSAGHGGLYHAQIFEGVTDDEFAGRCWTVAVQGIGDAAREAAEKREAEKAEKKRRADEEIDTRFLVALDRLCRKAPAATLTAIRDATGLNTDKARQSSARLQEAGTIELHDFDRKCGPTRKRVSGFRRVVLDGKPDLPFSGPDGPDKTAFSTGPSGPSASSCRRPGPDGPDGPDSPPKGESGTSPDRTGPRTKKRTGRKRKAKK